MEGGHSPGGAVGEGCVCPMGAVSYLPAEAFLLAQASSSYALHNPEQDGRGT